MQVKNIISLGSVVSSIQTSLKNEERTGLTDELESQSFHGKKTLRWYIHGSEL